MRSLHFAWKTLTIMSVRLETLGPGLLRAILRDVEMSVDELIDLL